MKPVVRAVLRDALKDTRHVRAVPPAHAEGLVARTYAQIERDFGVLAPPLALHSPAPAALAAVWSLLRELLLVEAEVGRAVKEVVATEVSRANACPYCVQVHEASVETLPALPAGTTEGIAGWARQSAVHPAGESAGQVPGAAAPEVYGVAVAFHYINRMVHLYLPDSPVPAQAPGFLRGTILRTAAKAMRPASGEPLVPGLSLTLLPEAPLPDELHWAVGNPNAAEALARAVAAVTEGARWVPPPVRACLTELLSEWDGTSRGPGRAWLDGPLGAVPDAERPAARLALLTAFAPFQVVDADVAAFRERYPSDRRLIELTSWAALTTALRIGDRFPAPVKPA